MLTDGIKFLGVSIAENLAIASGASLPTTGLHTGELFFQTGVGLHIYNGSAWTRVTPVVTPAVGTGAALPTSGATLGNLFYQTGVGLFVYNGTAWARVTPDAPVIPYDIAGSIFGKPTAPSLVFRFVANRPFSLPVGLTGSRASTSTVATAATILNIYRNGVVIGTINFAAGATAGTFTFASATAFAAGDLLTVGYPTADATFGDAQFTFAATLV